MPDKAKGRKSGKAAAVKASAKPKALRMAKAAGSKQPTETSQ